MMTTQMSCPHCGAQLSFGQELTPGMMVDCLVCMANIEVQAGMMQVSPSVAPPEHPVAIQPEQMTPVEPAPVVSAPASETPALAAEPMAIEAKAAEPMATEPVPMSIPYAPPPGTATAAPPSRSGSDYVLFGVLALAACLGLFFALPRFGVVDDDEIETPKALVDPGKQLAQGIEPSPENEARKKEEQGSNLFEGLASNATNEEIKQLLVAAKKKKVNEELLSVELPRALAESDEELYRKAMELAQKSLDVGSYDQAINWFQIAGKLHNSDQVMQGLKLAETRRTEALAQESRRRQQAERETRLAGYERWMVKGKASLFLQEFDQAIGAFQQALKLFPDDLRARASLAEVDVARRRVQTLQDEEQRRLALLRERRAKQASDEYKLAMKEGYQALNRGGFLQALGNFSQAKRLCPWAEEAHDAWDRARRNLDLEQAEARKREDEKVRDEIEARKKLELREQGAAFDRFMLEGRRSLDRQQHDQAAVAFAQAMQLRPDLAEPTDLKRQAERGRDDLHRAQALADKDRADKLIRESQEAFQRSESLQRDQALRRKQDDAARDRNLMEQLVLDTNLALATHDYVKAIELVGKGRQLQPGDPRFGLLLEDAQRGQKQRQDAIERDRLLIQELALAKDNAARVRIEEKQRTEALALVKAREGQQRLMIDMMLKEGRQAFGVGRLDMALQQFEGVVRLQPNHPELAQWLPKARQQREAFNQGVALDQKKRAEEIALAQGLARQQQQKVEQFQADQQKLRDQQRRARDFGQAMIEGRLALGKGKFDLAKTQFDKAKQLQIDDPQLDKLLEQAAQGRDEQAVRKAKEDQRVALERSRLAEEATQRKAERALIDQDRLSLSQAKQRQQEFQTQVKRGQDALGKQKLDQAIVAFSQALEMKPGDTVAQEGLQRARGLRDTELNRSMLAQEKLESDRAVEQAKLRERQAERDAEQFVKFGQRALGKKDYDSARLAFMQAVQLRPDDQAARLGLEQANQGREQFVAQNTSLSDSARQRHEQQKAADEAQRKALADAKAQAARAVEQKHDLDAENLTRLLAAARAGIELRRFDAASAALEMARKITPDDPAVARLAQDMELAKADAENAKVRDALKLLPFDAREQKALDQARVDLRVAEGRRHLEAGRHDEAIRELQAALRIRPGHAEASELLGRANRR